MAERTAEAIEQAERLSRLDALDEAQTTAMAAAWFRGELESMEAAKFRVLQRWLFTGEISAE